MVVLRIVFLNGVYHAADPTAHTLPEWPPHPDRVFQALVSAAYGTGLDPTPLRELEGQPPEVVFGAAHAVYGATHYVPAAYKAPQSRVAKYAPMMVDIGEPAYLCWPEASPALREPLAAIAAGVDYLGRAKTPVTMDVTTTVPNLAYRLKPSPDGDELLRIPHRGRLDELDAAFAGGRRAGLAEMAAYTDAHDRVAASPWGELLTLRPRGTIGLRHAAQLAEGLRAAVLSQAGDSASPLLHGHRGDHAAWTILPDVGHTRALGHVLGLGLWLPRGIGDAERTACMLPLMQVDHVRLDRHRIEVGTQSTHQQMPRGLWRRTWARASRTWASVTPMVLDRHPKRGRHLEDLVADSVVLAGHPRPVDVAVGQQPMVQGVPLAREFRPRNRGHWMHVSLAFEQRVAGPLLIGRDRHFGMGLMRPLEG